MKGEWELKDDDDNSEEEEKTFELLVLNCEGIQNAKLSLDLTMGNGERPEMKWH